MMDKDIQNFSTGLLKQARRVAVLTGAGISAESGVPTFRGQNGLWKQYRAEALATPEAFNQNPKLIWEWYNWRREVISRVMPNPGHQTLAAWEKIFPEFSLITQNVDGLHSKAGSRSIIELHGNIWKLRCIKEESVIEDHSVPLRDLPPRCSQCGGLLRPHVVWFGETLNPQILQRAFTISSSCDIMFVVGTSAFVQPAASLPLNASEAGAKIVEINPEPTSLTAYADFVFNGKAGEILPLIDKYIRDAAG